MCWIKKGLFLLVIGSCTTQAGELDTKELNNVKESEVTNTLIQEKASLLKKRNLDPEQVVGKEKTTYSLSKGKVSDVKISVSPDVVAKSIETTGSTKKKSKSRKHKILCGFGIGLGIGICIIVGRSLTKKKN